MKEEIISVLKEVKPEYDFSNNDGFISNGIITSFDLVLLVSLLNEKFNINITVVDLVPENFESLEDIEKLINKLK